MKTKAVILHCHIFKNAGTTLDWALQRSFGNGFIDHRDDDKMRQGSIEYLDRFLKSNSAVRSLSSHHMPFMPEHKKPYFWLILLREPISRARSVYEFEARQPISTIGSKMAKELSLSNYIHWRMQDDVQPVIKNYHVRYFCNKAILRGEIKDLDLDRAFQRLALNNVLVGTVERFDESMVIFEETLKKYFSDIDLSYVRQNVGIHKHDLPHSFLNDIKPESRELLLVNNQMDIRLHKMVCENQKKAICETLDFGDKLDSFQARCDSLRLGTVD